MRRIQDRFEVDIISPSAHSFTRDGYRYIALPPRSNYAIRLDNHGETRCDAEVTVDGQFIGSWRIAAHDGITIDRPGGIGRVFTFVGETSSIARRTGAVAGASKNGLITVVFKPARRMPMRSPPRTVLSTRASPSATMMSAAPRSSMPSSQFRAPSPQRESRASYGSGVTVLGRRSEQEFSNVDALTRDEIDWNAVTEISIRLVTDERLREEEYVPISRGSPPRIDEYYPRY